MLLNGCEERLPPLDPPQEAATDAPADEPQGTETTAQSPGRTQPNASEAGPNETSPATDASTEAVATSGSPAPAEPERSRQDMRCNFDAAGEQLTDYSQPGPHAVGILELALEDTSRPIEMTADHPAAPSRVLITRIYYPSSGPAPLFDAAPLQSGGPFAALIYSHGFSSSRDESNRVGRHAASHGYIVVAADYPLTNIGANAGMPDVTDVANQPADVSFLIDQLLGFSADETHTLADGVDEERIGALGVSLGGLTSLLVGYHSELHDPRVRAVAPIAAPSFFFTERYYDTRDLPLLFFHGDLDAFIDYELNARQALVRAAPSARLVTIAAGTHTGFGAPVEGALLSLAQPLFAPPEAHPDNPDGLGCGYVGAGLADTGPEFLEGIAGPGVESSEEENAAALPCMGDEYTMPAIPLDEQMSLLAAGTVAFFDAHLGADEATREDGCRYLLQALPAHPAVSLE